MVTKFGHNICDSLGCGIQQCFASLTFAKIKIAKQSPKGYTSEVGFLLCNKIHLNNIQQSKDALRRSPGLSKDFFLRAVEFLSESCNVVMW